MSLLFHTGKGVIEVSQSLGNLIHDEGRLDEKMVVSEVLQLGKQ